MWHRADACWMDACSVVPLSQLEVRPIQPLVLQAQRLPQGPSRLLASFFAEYSAQMAKL